MSVTVELNLPDALVAEARAKGLLQPGQISDLVAEELRRCKARDELALALKKIRARLGEPMSEEEVQAEINAVRAERRARENRH